MEAFLAPAITTLTTYAPPQATTNHCSYAFIFEKKIGLAQPLLGYTIIIILAIDMRLLFPPWQHTTTAWCLQQSRLRLQYGILGCTKSASSAAPCPTPRQSCSWCPNWVTLCLERAFQSSFGRMALVRKNQTFLSRYVEVIRAYLSRKHR